MAAPMLLACWKSARKWRIPRARVMRVKPDMSEMSTARTRPALAHRSSSRARFASASGGVNFHAARCSYSSCREISCGFLDISSLQDPAQLVEPRQGGVFLREQRVLRRPVDPRRIPQRADLVLRIVQVGALVFHFGVLAEHAEAVQQAGRHEELVEVLIGEPVADPAARADIHRDVEDLPAHRAYQLALRLLALAVQPAERAALRARMVVLDERVRDAALAIFRGVKGLEKKSAPVAMDVGLDQDDAGKPGLVELQGHLSNR